MKNYILTILVTVLICYIIHVIYNETLIIQDNTTTVKIKLNKNLSHFWEKSISNGSMIITFKDEDLKDKYVNKLYEVTP